MPGLNIKVNLDLGELLTPEAIGTLKSWYLRLHDLDPAFLTEEDQEIYEALKAINKKFYEGEKGNE